MNPQAKTTRQNERGALMIEAIALLGLMTMMSPMVVRQTADRTAEMEEVAIAGQMKEMKDALSNWIDAHYQERTAAFANSNTLDTHFTVNASQLAEYLSANYLDGSNFRGNKLADGFDIGVRAQCTEAARTDGSDCVSGTCYTMTNGAVTSIADTATTKCSRYKMTGMILSRSDSEIDDRRASRIASMIGADGGYMRTSTLVNAMSAGSAATEMTKIMGAQGIWEGNVGDFFTGMSTARGGRVAATTTYSSGFSGDYLYRKKVDGLPGANSMFTDLDMGGATECNADGCHKINNAGGMEVIGGKILIRSRNGAAARDGVVGNSGDADYARIALATDESHVYSNNSVTIGTGPNPDNASVRVASGVVDLTPAAVSGTYMNMRNGNVGFQVQSTTLNMNSGFINGRAPGGVEFNAYSGDFKARAGVNANITASRGLILNALGGDTRMYSARTTEITANTNMILDAANSMDLYGRQINAVADNRITAFIGGGYTSVNMTNGAIRQKTRYAQINMLDGNKSIKLDIDNNNVGGSSYLASSLTLNNNTFQVYTPRTSLSRSHLALNGQGLNITMGNTANNLSEVRQLFYQNNGLELYTGASGSYADGRIKREGHRIDFTYGDNRTKMASIVVQQGSNPPFFLGDDRNRGVAVSVVVGNESATKPLVSMYGESGRVSGVFFQPERMAYGNGQRGSVVLNRTMTSINADTGVQTGYMYGGNIISVPGSTGLPTISLAETAAVFINNRGIPYDPYRSHYSNDRSKYNKFRVDPAFISVMNDIKVTSRGGARLSEALPNYILKGIYEMTNSYGAGSWPCVAGEEVAGSCTWHVPKFTKDDLFLSSDSPEFSCDAFGNTHPIRNGGGTCSETGGYVTFSLYANTYTECPEDMNCWAHPYMGTVPAPGRKVTEKSKTGQNGTEKENVLAAQDEGVCPDGYQAVMTLTPTAFDVGRVSYINPNYDITSAKVAYNAGWQNFKNESNRRAAGIMQAATRIGTAISEDIEVNTSANTRTLRGWKIAMGTVTPYGSGGGYIWNAGGVSVNSMGAVAHTYCYFNPQRFNMPNMRFMDETGDPQPTGGSGSILTPMDNPILGSSNSDWMW